MLIRAKNTGTNMEQKDYEALRKDVLGMIDGKQMSEAEAKVLINEEFGFEVSRIRIRNTARSYNVDTETHKIHFDESYEREPFYSATDWNYIRFDVQGCAATYSWEMVNGELYPYNT